MKIIEGMGDRKSRDRALQERDVARQKQMQAESMRHDALARAEKAEAELAAERARWAALRALYERERDYWNGPDVGYAPAVNPAAQAKRAQEILDAMDALSTPADAVKVVVTHRVAPDPSEDLSPGLVIRGEDLWAEQGDVCYLVKGGGE